MSCEPHPTDEDLVERVKRSPQDDLRAFESLVLRHRDRIRANCRYLTKAPEEAEDLAQEVFVKAFFGLPRFEGRARFRTWLERLKVNHCLTFLSRRRRRTFIGLDDPTLEDEPETQVHRTAAHEFVGRSERERIAAILDSLPDTLRIPLILRDLDGLAYDEIADVLQVGLSAVKMRIKRGREMFRARYEAPAGAGQSARVPDSPEPP